MDKATWLEGMYGIRADQTPSKTPRLGKTTTTVQKGSVGKINYAGYITGYLEANGYGPARPSGDWLMYKCPFHDDRKPSFCVSPIGYVDCKGCGFKGNSTQFFRKLNCPIPWHSTDTGALKYTSTTTTPAAPKPSDIDAAALWDSLKTSSLTQQHNDFIKHRRFEPVVESGQLRCGVHKGQSFVAVPCVNAEGKLVRVALRFLDAGDVKFMYWPSGVGQKTVMMQPEDFQRLKSKDDIKIYVAEGITDYAAVICELEKRPSGAYVVVGIAGANEGSAFLEVVGPLAQYRHVDLLVDQDEAGNRAAEEIKNSLGLSNTHRLKWNDSAKDVSELRAKYDMTTQVWWV